MNELTEFKSWLKKNRLILKGRTPDEVAFLARWVGWDPEMVYSVLSHFETAIRGGCIERTAAFHVGNEVYEMERKSGKIHLDQQWSELKDYLVYGKCFGE